jgi:hypothetical protein
VGLLPFPHERFRACTHKRGQIIQPYADSYNLLGVAAHVKPGTLPVDATGLLKSRAEDIKNETETLIIPVTDQFNQDFAVGRTFYGLFLIPKILNPADFSTIRQAEKIGIKTLWGGGGPQ